MMSGLSRHTWAKTYSSTDLVYNCFVLPGMFYFQKSESHFLPIVTYRSKVPSPAIATSNATIPAFGNS
jgi:hypothetical protein